MAEKKISIGGQVFSEAVDHFYLRLPLKIDENVAAENQVKRTSDRKGFLREIEPLKSDNPSEFVYRFNFALLRAEAFQQELTLELNRNAGDFLNRPDPGRSPGHDLCRNASARSKTLTI